MVKKLLLSKSQELRGAENQRSNPQNVYSYVPNLGILCVSEAADDIHFGKFHTVSFTVCTTFFDFVTFQEISPLNCKVRSIKVTQLWCCRIRIIGTSAYFRN